LDSSESSRFTKPGTPVLPGFCPQFSAAQAVGDSAGSTVPSGAKVPWSASCFRCGSFPSGHHRLDRARIGAVETEHDDAALGLACERKRARGEREHRDRDEDCARKERAPNSNAGAEK